MRKNAFAGLRVINCSACKIATDGHADDRGRGPSAVGTPAHQREFIVNLVHGRPDVIKELDFDYGLHATDGVSDCTTHDIGFGQRRVEHAFRTELRLQA